MLPRPSIMLPYLTSNLTGIGGVLRARPEDFHVEELPAYLPSGEGEHTYVTIEKTGHTTRHAADLLARALGANPREIGWAGMKDRHAVTVQTLSFARVDPALVEKITLDGIKILSVARHKNKLKPGHLRGNRFTLRVTNPSAADALAQCLRIAELVRAHGIPNYFGAQRFGREGTNADRGRRWLRGEAPAPRDPFERRLLVSSVQSELFNSVLARRVSDGTMASYLDGDLAVRHPTGGPWPIDPGEAQALYDTHNASPTGPMFGAEMRAPTGSVAALETEVLSASGVTLEDLARARDLAQGTRRALRVLVDDLVVTNDNDGALRFSFSLPSGGYATSVLREFCKSQDDSETDVG